jgi:hypothetical protein
MDYTRKYNVIVALPYIEDILCPRRSLWLCGTRARERRQTIVHRRAGSRQRPPFIKRKDKKTLPKKVSPLSAEKKSLCITMGFCNSFCYKLAFLGVPLWAGGSS